MKKTVLNDPIGADRRKSMAARRVGVNAKCDCGEARPEALIARSVHVICTECQRKMERKSTLDRHHFAGKPNSPITIDVPANDHRADLSVAQMDWPKRTRENPDNSPLLSAAASIRGFIDTMIYLINKGLEWIAAMLEKADAVLTETLGPNWWADMGLISPKRREQ